MNNLQTSCVYFPNNPVEYRNTYVVELGLFQYQFNKIIKFYSTTQAIDSLENVTEHDDDDDDGSFFEGEIHQLVYRSETAQKEKKVIKKFLLKVIVVIDKDNCKHVYINNSEADVSFRIVRDLVIEIV